MAYQRNPRTKSSWEKSSKWYSGIVKEKGHYYHENVIFDKLLDLCPVADTDRVLDVGCGEGVLSRVISEKARYTGIDASPSLIKIATAKSKKGGSREFIAADATKPFPIKNRTYTKAFLILALQNMSDARAVIKNISKYLDKHGELAIVLNHPCFRIPRQSSWGVDSARKIEYRRIDRYMSPMEIPITTHPGERNTSTVTWSYHVPLSEYTKILKEEGFSISLLDEWVSDKKSKGKAARMENRGRSEFPLFLCIIARKD